MALCNEALIPIPVRDHDVSGAVSWNSETVLCGEAAADMARTGQRVSESKLQLP